MITPKFKITQDNNYLHIVIHAPYVKAQNVDFYVDGKEFRFHIAPYFLRLNLPGEVIEDERSIAKYDIEKGDFIIKVAKLNVGEEFEDLDLVSKLLATKMELNKNKTPLIEVINSTNHEVPPSERLDVEDIDWEIPQKVEEKTTSLITKDGYGFNQKYTGYLLHVKEGGNDVNEILDPEASTFEERRMTRIENEDTQFDDDHYINDYLNQNEPYFQSILKYKTKWEKIFKEVQREYNLINKGQNKDNVNIQEKEQKEQKKNDNSLLLIEEIDHTSVVKDNDVPIQSKIQEIPSSTNELSDVMETLSIKPKIEMINPKLDDIANQNKHLKLTEKEKEILLNLPNREFIIENNEERCIYLGLTDLILAYCYDLRINEGDSNVESAWCIGKLAATISCLEKFEQLEEVLISNRRRSLAYPLYRNFELSEKIVNDCYYIFKLGKRALLKVLLEIKHTFDHHEIYYIYSKIILDDYIIWLQSMAKVNPIRGLANMLHKTKLEKETFDDWYLIALEELSKEAEIIED
ncbi:SHQ1-domain-containing protein [Neoconidiobolus thromboides FSU 785]|nr:SHQ1-domain-containing protein [Neoconidiobolus thromboides FSU 785]